MAQRRKKKKRDWKAAALNQAAYVVAAAVWGVMSRLPIGTASGFGSHVGRNFAPRVMKLKVIKRNLRLAFPEADEAGIDRMTRGIFENFARVAAEISHLGAYRRGEEGTEIIIEGREHVEAGKPAVFVGSHLSNWEIGVVAIARVTGDLNTIFTPVGIPAIDRLLQKFRIESGANYLPRSRQSLRTIFNGIESGTSVAMLVDQRVDNGPVVKFFGHDTVASSLPGRIAVRYDVPIIPVDGERVTPSKFIVRLHPPIHPRDHAGPDQMQTMTQQMMAAIEGFIRRSPDTWFCHKTRWKPDEAAQRTAREDAAPELARDTVMEDF